MVDLGFEFNFSERVPRELVHRTSADEVFIVGGHLIAPERTLLAARWPATHHLHHPDAHGSSDPLLFVETARQAAIFIAHRFYDVPLTHRFIFCSLDLYLDDDRPVQPDAAAVDVVLATRLSTEGKPSRRHFAARLDVSFHVAGRRWGQIAVRFLAVEHELYSAIRRRSSEVPDLPAFVPPADALQPDLVGRRHRENVLLAYRPEGGTGAYRMHLDPLHRGYFEHKCDHVPGIALAEAFLQASHHAVHHAPAASGGPSYQLTSAVTHFDQFGELHAPVEIGIADPVHERPGDRKVLQLTAAQDDRVIARSFTAYRPIRRT